MKKEATQIEHYTFAATRKVHPGVVGHLACHEVKEGNEIPLHDHDFFEMQCGCEGKAMQTFNGKLAPFLENEIYMLRPEDVHEIYTLPGQTFIYYNIAFERERLQFICDNYHLDIANQWLNNPNCQRKYRLPIKSQEIIRQGMKEMLLDRKRRFALDRFLFNFFFVLEQHQNNPYAECPEWLQETIARLDEPQWLQMGPRAMEKISGYSLEYIGRILKKHAGLLPRDVLNQIRMEHAAVSLTLGAKDIYEIADECGLESQCYFFRLFKKTYGCTPLQYRKSNR